MEGGEAVEFGSGDAECGMKKNRRWRAVEFGSGKLK
jgi:hypothetical protein